MAPGTKRRLDILSLLLLTCIAAAWFARDILSLEELTRRENQLRQTIRSRPVLSFSVGLLVYVVTSLIPGTSGKSIIYGWLFGFWQAVIIVLTGLTVAAMITFWVSRSLLRPWVESRFRVVVTRLNEHLQTDAAVYLLTLQLANVPYTLINYACGASRVRAWTFCWTTLVGLLPGTLVFVYAGTQLPTLADLSNRGIMSLVEPKLLAALALSAALPFTLRWLVRRIRNPGPSVLGETPLSPHKKQRPNP
jgi:uncharacterized membrane protein YdjX (TVP38/TMEM64 family)